MGRYRLEDNRQEPLRQFNRPVHLPDAAIRLDRFWRNDKYDGIGLGNQASKARFPILASCDVVTVQEWRESAKFKPGYQFVGKCRRITPRIGDEDLELLACVCVGHGYVTKSKSVARCHKI